MENQKILDKEIISKKMTELEEENGMLPVECAVDASYSIVKTGELSDDELDGVSGGVSYEYMEDALYLYHRFGTVVSDGCCSSYQLSPSFVTADVSCCANCLYWKEQNDGNDGAFGTCMRKAMSM